MNVLYFPCRVSSLSHSEALLFHQNSRQFGLEGYKVYCSHTMQPHHLLQAPETFPFFTFTTKAPPLFSLPLVEGSAESMQQRGTAAAVGGQGLREKRQGTVNTRHGSSFKVMNSNESSAGRLLGDKKEHLTTWAHVISLRRLWSATVGEVLLPTSRVADSPFPMTGSARSSGCARLGWQPLRGGASSRALRCDL